MSIPQLSKQPTAALRRTAASSIQGSSVLHRLLLFSVGALLLFSALAHGTEPDNTMNQALEAARKAFDEGLFGKSVELTRQHLDSAPELSAKQRHEALLLLGRARTKLADYDQALADLNDAQAQARAAGLRAGQASALIAIGDVHERMKRHAQALETYDQALDLAQLPDDWRIAQGAKVQIGDIHVVTGRFEQARAAYEAALRYAELANDGPAIAQSLDYLGYFFRRIGDTENAIASHERAIVQAGQFADRKPGLSALARAHNHLGLSYQLAAEIVDRGRAAELLVRAQQSEEDALRYAELAEDRLRQGYVLRALANILRDRAQADPTNREVHWQQALRHAEHAREIAAEMKDAEWTGLALHSLAPIEARLGNLDAANNALSQAIEIWQKIGDRYSLGWAFRMRAEQVADSRGDADGARADYLRALEQFTALGVSEDVTQVYFLLSSHLAKTGAQASAIYFGKLAVNTVQAMRSDLRNFERESQRAFVRTKGAVYRNLADLLIDAGRLAEAQQVLAMLKEEELFDFIRRSQTEDNRATRASYTGTEETWQKRYQEISSRLGTIAVEIEDLDRKALIGLSEAETRRREELRADRRSSQQAFDKFLSDLMRELDSASAERNREVGERNLANLRYLQDTLASLGHGAVAIHYVMGDAKLRMIITTPAIQIARESPIAAKELNRKIHDFRMMLAAPERDPLPEAQELYRHLIAPIAADLKQLRARTLMVSLDGALRYIPLVALHDGKKYLVEEFSLALYTEAAKDRLKDDPKRRWSVAGLGVTRQIEGFSALPSVRQEIEAVVKVGSRGVLPGEAHLDGAFDAKRFIEALDKRYPVLHIASHFVFQPGNESNSFLLLGDGRRLTLRAIREEDFRFRDVDLLTLSACETAIGGGTDANGLEIEGFGALAQKQGAKGVIATLWQVADQSTAVLMHHLYRLREENRGMTKADALREAQLKLLRAPKAKAADKVYSHPYYWAPFILMGNWR